jgi:hypothetical protein
LDEAEMGIMCGTFEKGVISRAAGVRPSGVREISVPIAQILRIVPDLPISQAREARQGLPASDAKWSKLASCHI